MKKIIEAVFMQDGKVYVGMFSLSVLAMAIAEFCTSDPRFRAPGWLVEIPDGVLAFVLGVFVLAKGWNYTVDSKYNSPPGVPPVKP